MQTLCFIVGKVDKVKYSTSTSSSSHAVLLAEHMSSTVASATRGSSTSTQWTNRDLNYLRALCIPGTVVGT